MDLAHQIEVLDLLAELNAREGRTIVFVLHDLNLACRYADHLIAMNDGRIVTERTPRAVHHHRAGRRPLRLHAELVADPITATPPVKIRVGEGVCLEVRWAPAPDASHRVLPPCAFHKAVTRALALRRAGEQVAMRGVASGTEPAIDWGVAPGARLLPGGVVRIDDGDAWHHAGPVLAAEHHVTDALAHAPGLAAGRNEGLGVSIVHGTTTKGDRAASRAVVDAVLDVMAEAGVADLEQRLSGRVTAVPEPPFRR